MKLDTTRARNLFARIVRIFITLFIFLPCSSGGDSLRNMTRTISTKLLALRFPLMFFVVLIHTDAGIIVLDRMLEPVDLRPSFAYITLTAVVPGLTSLAVPMFFTISGYLFFYAFQGGTRQFLGKYKRRFWSLVVPYTFWSAIYLIAVCLWQQVSGSSVGLTPPVRLSELLQRLFIRPFANQIWFVRDLILLTLVSPIIWHMLRKYGVATLLVMGSLWLLGLCPGWERKIISLTGPFFFATGAYLAIWRIDVESPILGRRLIGVAWLCFLIAGAVLATKHNGAFGLTMRIAVLLGLPAAWYNYDLLRRPLESRLGIQLAQVSFFIYAGQNLTATFTEKSLAAVWPFGEWSLGLALLVGGTIITGTWLLAALGTSRLFPSVYTLLAGRRTRIGLRDQTS